MNKPLPVLVAPSFKRTLVEIYNYIYERSESAAENLVDGINEQLAIIPKYPSAYPHETRMPTKRRIYRFKKYKKNYKIIFKVLKSKIIFIAVIYAKRGEAAYQKLRTTKYR